MAGGLYAVFGCTVGSVHATYEDIFHEWLPTGEHRQDPARPCFERHAPGTSQGTDPVRIHVPITG